MNDQPAGLRSGAWRRAAMVLGAWTIVAIISTTHRYFGDNQNVPQSVGWWSTFFSRLPNWYLWAVLTPGIALSARLAPLSPGLLKWSVPYHLLVAGIAAGAFEILFVPLRLLAIHYFMPNVRLEGDPLDPGFIRSTIRSAFESRFVADYFVYWAIVLAVSVYREALRGSWKERDIARIRSELSRARLEALGNRVHPHFLFNTLNAVSALARTGRCADVIRVVDDLSDVLRVSLGTHNRLEVHLRDEMNLTRKYLGIEKVRFGDRIAYDIDVEPATEPCLVPPLIVQPLIENAVLHGVAPSAHPQKIAVRAYREKDRVHITVKNTVDPSAREVAGLRVGLDTIRQRLETMYQEKASLTVDHGDGVVEASIILPARTEPGS